MRSDYLVSDETGEIVKPDYKGKTKKGSTFYIAQTAE
jgi:hypothetical protein